MITSMFDKLSIKKKFLYILFSGILFLSIISFICFHFISKAYQKNLYQSVSNTLTYTADSILLKANNIEVISEMILGDQNIQNDLFQLSTDLSPSNQNALMGSIYQELINYLFGYNGTSSISNISLLTTNDLFISTASNKTKTLPDKILKTLVQKAEEGDGASIWFTDYSNDYGVFLVKELKQTKGLSLTPLGYLMICVDVPSLTEHSVSYLNSDNSTYLLSDGTNILYQSNEVSMETSNFCQKESYGYTIEDIKHIKFFIVKHKISALNWDYISLIPYNTIFQTIRLTKTLCIFSFLICLIIIFFISSKLMSSLIYHIELLVSKIKAFGNGTYSEDTFPDTTANRSDEIGLLHRTFDSMVNQINRLVFDNYRNEILKRDAQIKAMENQINPHFLYNTLDTINWRPKAIGADDIMKISQSLGSLLRITLKNSEKPYTVAEELNVLHNYITIQQQRYGEKLDFQSSVPEKFNAYRIPKLILQPLLENAIHYGLEENAETCHISLKAFLSKENLIFQVKNNGSSFEDNLLERLRSKEVLPHGHGISLLNIDQRLKLTYGEHYGLKLYNKDDLELAEEYAVAELYLPVPEKENQLC